MATLIALSLLAVAFESSEPATFIDPQTRAAMGRDLFEAFQTRDAAALVAMLADMDESKALCPGLHDVERYADVVIQFTPPRGIEEAGGEAAMRAKLRAANPKRMKDYEEMKPARLLVRVNEELERCHGAVDLGERTIVKIEGADRRMRKGWSCSASRS